MHFYYNFLTFKPRPDLTPNYNDIESLTMEIIIKKEKMLLIVHSIDNNPVFLNNVKHILEISLIK